MHDDAHDDGDRDKMYIHNANKSCAARNKG